MAKANLSSKTMCILPFVHVATKTDGSVKLCCRSNTIGNINNSPLSSIWNNDQYKEIRRKVLNDERPVECEACWRQEDIGVRSLRQRYNVSRLPNYINRLDELNDDYSMPFRIPIIEAKLSNLCNLKCRMCHPLDSTSWAKDWPAISHLMKDNNESTYTKVHSLKLNIKPFLNAWEGNDKFWDEFDELLPYFDRIEFAGGEPIIDPTHYRILEKLLPRADQINLKYSTNLTKLDFKGKPIQELWDKFKRIDLIISIDGVNEMYEYVRQLGSYKTLQNNIKTAHACKNIHMAGSCTFQVYNVFSLPEIFDAFVEQLDIGVQSHLVNYPKFLDMRVMPLDIKKVLTNTLETYKDSINSKIHPNWTADRKANAKKYTIDVINALNGGDMTALLPEFVEFSDTLDHEQGCTQSWRQLLPDLNQSIIRKLNE